MLAVGSLIPANAVLPLLVFAAETSVVTLATLRVIFIARGKKAPAALLGFFEVSIWLFAIGQVMQNLSSLGCCAAFAAGFSLGNYLGVLIEGKLALGNLVVQVTTTREVTLLIEALRSAGYGVTKLDGQGATGPVQVVFTVIERKHVANVAAIIEHFDPKAFYSINDLQAASEGVFPAAKRPLGRIFPVFFPKRYGVVLAGGGGEVVGSAGGEGTGEGSGRKPALPVDTGRAAA
jgi:uncharacterized protein YebE (UPF0316 family)